MNDTEIINQQKALQLATVSADGQPWVCSVYFVIHAGKIYWLSFPERRHSKEIAANQKVAVTVAVHQDTPVVGMQAEGDVHVVNNISEATSVLLAYVKKYGKGGKFIELMKRGSNHHRLYCMVPRVVMLFDERTPHESPYRQITLE
jgi:uncharacterized protein YhbP (UPF0306 family)